MEHSSTPQIAVEKFPIGQRVTLPGHFLEPVTLESIRFIRSGYECRVRLPDGTPDEAIFSLEEGAALAGQTIITPTLIRPADAEKLRLLVESARIRLAYAHDRQFAVSLSGIRTLPHQIEAVYMKMLPQPRLRFLLADDPGAGKTIMAGLLLKEMKLREAVERIPPTTYHLLFGFNPLLEPELCPPHNALFQKGRRNTSNKLFDRRSLMPLT
jgi:hypothetical protein